MNEHTISNYSIPDIVTFKRKMLSWANQFNIFCFLDNQGYAIPPNKYECILAVGAATQSNDSEPFELLDGYLTQGKWYFGHLSFELGYEWFNLEGKKDTHINFPEHFFFQPQILIHIVADKAYINAIDPDSIYEQIVKQKPAPASRNSIHLESRISKSAYLDIIKNLQQHIQRGDCYEINFCQEFYAENVTIDPISVFDQLLQQSPNPFSVLYKWNDQYLLCASPERFINKSGSRLVSQPIKGTAKRDLDDQETDLRLRSNLLSSSKERAENVMVVDLVRNDLSIVCKEGSVNVDELFGIYSFPQVHQMISTVSGTLKEEVSFSQIMKATFPMGSMTGAPKKRVMELIHQYEINGRGIFSGTVGYFTPDGDFDFNVVIRSLMYNANHQYLSCLVGSGITIYSDPEKEWEECLLKAEAIKKVLT